MREILPQRLWIGNAQDARNVRQTLSSGVTTIIDLAIDELPIVYPRDINYCRLPLVDGGGNSQVSLVAAIQTAITFVSGEAPTLITCSAGMSRSVAITAAVVSVIRRLQPEAALKQVALAGPHDVSPDLWADVKIALAEISAL